MRFLIAAIMFSFLLPGAALAQSNATPPQTNTKKPAAQAATKPPEDKTAAPAANTPEAAASQEQRPRESSGDKEKDKEERYDMTEVAPVVTHHQITVDGKLLKYSGRGQASSDVCVQWRPGIVHHLAAHGRARPAQSSASARRLHAARSLSH
jgi:hypothetical protein